MYPLEWKAAGKPCLVVGGGPVAVRKVNRLLQEGAHVTVISPEVEESLQKLAEQGMIRWLRRAYRQNDWQGFALVISAAGVEEIASWLEEAAEREHFLYNAADFPERGNCYLPARFDVSGLSVSLSTGGRAPGLARELSRRWKQSLEQSDDKLILDFLFLLSGEVLKGTDPSRRRPFWEAAFSPEVLSFLHKKEWHKAREAIIDAVNRLGNQS
jgi:precorrin-2 dehydrogenase/sirohydrochlorin ferrochelatase